MIAMPAKKIRIYSPYSPKSLTEGAFHIILNQEKTFQELGFQVEVRTWKNFGEKEPLLKRAERIVSSWFSDAASPEKFYYPRQDDPIHQNIPSADLGIYHYSFAYHWLQVRPRPTERKTIVYFHNLESELFKIRKSASQNPLGRWIHQRNAEKLARHEIQLQDLADELWFASGVDYQIYLKHCRPENSAKFRLIPPGFEREIFEKRSHLPQLKSNSELATRSLQLGIIGRYDFEPNRASLEWIIENLAPRLKQSNFQGRLKVAGKGIPPDLAKKAHAYPFIDLLGFVEDVEYFWKDLSFLLVPQCGGSGIRIKLLEALASGIPVLANEEAIQPLHPKLRASPLLFTSDDPAAWVNRILSERALETRTRFQSKGPEPELIGTQIYRFLLADQSFNWL